MRRFQRISRGRETNCRATSISLNALGLIDLANFRVVGNPEVMPPIFRKILAAAVGRTCRSVPVLFQFANPNIAVADGVIVVLQC